MIITRYLIVSAKHEVRAVKRLPALEPDEVAIPLRLDFPDEWGTLSGEPVSIKLPKPIEDVEVGDEVIRSRDQQNSDG